MSHIIANEHYNYTIIKDTVYGSIQSLKENFKLNIIHNDGETLKFEVLNVPSELHNTLRRLILNEVPSVAIDRVFMYNNTTCIEDSDLQLRIGLIPIDVSPNVLEFYKKDLPYTDEISNFEHDASLLFELKVDYKKLTNVNLSRFENCVDPQRKNAIKKFMQVYKERSDRSVYSDQLVYCPYPKSEIPIAKPIENILLVRMMPHEEIFIKVLAVKGYGHDHAKFIPTSIAFGRRVHTLKLLSDIKGESAKTLQSLFPKGVIEIIRGTAVVGNPKLIQRTNKNFNEYEDLQGKVELGFDDNHFIWHIESVRPVNQPAHSILIQAYQTMIDKCTYYIDFLEKLENANEIAKKAGSLVDPKSLGSKVFGKFCYIEKEQKSKKFSIYRFYGETSTLGTSLPLIADYLYGKKLVCSYFDFELGIEITINSYQDTGIEPDQIIKDVLNALSDYFQYMMQVFMDQLSKNHENDVNME